MTRLRQRALGAVLWFLGSSSIGEVISSQPLFVAVNQTPVSCVGEIVKGSLQHWLRNVAFLGLGKVKKVELDSASSEIRLQISVVESWWGDDPGVVTVVWPFSERPEVTLVGERQRVVLLSYLSASPRSFGFFPVTRFKGTDAFLLAASVWIPPAMYVLPEERGGKRRWGLISVTVFRKAVRRIRRGV